MLEQHGLRPARYFYQMARPLSAPIPDPAFPAGYTLRHVAGDTDVERWVDCYNAAFIDHWQFTPRTLTRRRQQMAAPDYRPDLDLVLQAPDSTFAAFCWCTVNAEEHDEATQRDGWIATLGTRRGARGRGLGRALLLTGLLRLQALGLDTALLHVDAENPTGALRLYEGAGFAAVETDIMHTKDL